MRGTEWPGPELDNVLGCDEVRLVYSLSVSWSAMLEVICDGVLTESWSWELIIQDN